MYTIQTRMVNTLKGVYQ